MERIQKLLQDVDRDEKAIEVLTLERDTIKTNIEHTMKGKTGLESILKTYENQGDTKVDTRLILVDAYVFSLWGT